MVYALNVFNLVPGHEGEYRAYSARAAKIIYGLRGRVLQAGSNPIRRIHDDRERRQMIVVEFPSDAAFQKFLDEGERQDIHKLREASTTDYIWTLYEPWDLREWMSAGTEISITQG
jgi:uncharacterized protein (DUF1330 family)